MYYSLFVPHLSHDDFSGVTADSREHALLEFEKIVYEKQGERLRFSLNGDPTVASQNHLKERIPNDDGILVTSATFEVYHAVI